MPLNAPRLEGQAVSDITWLDVPFDEKDEAKALGAVWSREDQRWYAPSSKVSALTKWLPDGDVATTFPGEDLNWGSGLFVDLIPRTCWFTNVRSCVSQRDWERLRRVIVDRADSKCELCGATRDPSIKRWLEVHERWAYDQPTLTQTLKRLICLCTDCHTVTHFGFAQMRGLGERATEHLMKVNHIDRDEADEQIMDAFDLWDQRNQFIWTLDLTMLTDSGIRVDQPQPPQKRQKIAVETLEFD